jgi:hypothetical protein
MKRIPLYFGLFLTVPLIVPACIGRLREISGKPEDSQLLEDLNIWIGFGKVEIVPGT